ncbi:hypothetical protein ACFLY8_05785 [Halobacteriota archaeon]
MKIGIHKMGVSKILKYIVLAGAIAIIGISGCLSELEFYPAITPAPTPATTPAPCINLNELPIAPVSNSTEKLDILTSIQCPQDSEYLYISDINGELWWVCAVCNYTAPYKSQLCAV